MTAAEQFVTDRERGVYFWVIGGDPSRGEPDVQMSSHPHDLLPHYCEFHSWHSSDPCPVAHGPSPAPKWIEYDDETGESRPKCSQT
jgi:hypothetical protein